MDVDVVIRLLTSAPNFLWNYCYTRRRTLNADVVLRIRLHIMNMKVCGNVVNSGKEGRCSSLYNKAGKGMQIQFFSDTIQPQYISYTSSLSIINCYFSFGFHPTHLNHV
jgi:hypothetical protein